MHYAELHCKTNFSFLEGASHADELVEQAVASGYRALAVTDVNSLAGVVRAHLAAKETELHLVIGAELRLVDASRLVLWAPDRAAYGRLARLITLGRRQAPKGECHLRFQDLAAHSEGLLAGVLSEGDDLPTRNDLHGYRELFGDRCYLLAELHRGPDDRQKLEQLMQSARQVRLPLVAAGDVHYHAAARQPLHDVLTAIRHGVTVTAARPDLFANSQRHLRSLEEISALFADAPEALQRTREVVERCRFSLEELRYEYPEELAPDGMSTSDFLADLAWRGAQRRYPRGIPAKVERLLKHELQLIRELRYEAYFLTVWDLVKFARRQGILCQGRGSAANSVVCYCLGVTSVDPDRTDLLFERFVSRERNEAPDIDVDFEHARREEVLQYLYEKYGRERAGLTATVITYRARSAIRDAGKALGLSLDRVDALAKNVDGHARQIDLSQLCAQVGVDADSEIGRRFVHVVDQLIGFPRHLSQHVGGMVMTRGPLCELCPIENAAMPDRTVIQWDKDDLEELGILKVDCLALGMLTAIHKCFDLVRAHDGRSFNLATIPEGDSSVYDMICKADTIGVFQIESRAQMSMLPRLRPRCYYDLVIEVAIVRPGPIQGQMVHPYLRRRSGEERVTYPNEAIQQVLEKTLGVPLFQEQAMRLAVVAAGFTPGEADQLRRAMGAWRRQGVIDKFRRQLLAGMQERGLPEKFAEQVFQQIRGFGEYGFPESHAASFALLVYVSAWLKHYYPAAFTASLLNSQPMGFYAPAQLIRDARDHGVQVLPLDVNQSDWDCTLEAATSGDERKRSWALRLGLRQIVGFPQAAAEVLMQARRQGPFTNVDELTRRTGMSQALLVRLADADAFGSLNRDRRQALWSALGQEKKQRAMPLFEHLPDEDVPPETLPALTMQQEVFADYRTSGLSLRAHPVSFYRKELERLQITTAVRLKRMPTNRPVRVAGLVLLRQRPSTAKGITFVTLEDETGTINLVIRQPVWDRFHEVTRHSPAWIADGKLERTREVIHVVVNRLEDLSGRLGQVRNASRDFR